MFRACITITPEIIAFVVAIAGIIFPAMAKRDKQKKVIYQKLYYAVFFESCKTLGERGGGCGSEGWEGESATQ